MRRAVVLLTGVAFGLLGPKLTAPPHERAAGEPFAYEPPAGFAEVKEPAKGEREWANESRPGQIVVPRIHLSVSTVKGPVESGDLEVIAKGMPAMLEETGITWKDIRHETRTRDDGAHVGIVEGECTKTVTAQGMTKDSVSSAVVRYRRLLFVFPTNEGTASLTTIYGVDEIDKWQPAAEATIATAHGVAMRLPEQSPPIWMYFAWGVAGLAVGAVISRLLDARNAAPATKAEDKADA